MSGPAGQPPEPADPGEGDGETSASGSPSPFESGDAFSPSFRLTVAFLRRYPRYRDTLALTPEHYRFDRVLWNSSLATLRQLLASVAEHELLVVTPLEVDEAVRNLVEGIVLRGRSWGR